MIISFRYTRAAGQISKVSFQLIILILQSRYLSFLLFDISILYRKLITDFLKLVIHTIVRTPDPSRKHKEQHEQYSDDKAYADIQEGR